MELFEFYCCLKEFKSGQYFRDSKLSLRTLALRSKIKPLSVKTKRNMLLFEAASTSHNVSLVRTITDDSLVEQQLRKKIKTTRTIQRSKAFQNDYRPLTSGDLSPDDSIINLYWT